MLFRSKDALLRGNLDDFGALLNEAYVSKQQMNPHIADNTIADELYRKARQCGALGGKLLGAGGGGFLGALLPDRPSPRTASGARGDRRSIR